MAVLVHLLQNYNEHGIRRTVDAVLLVHNHGHPHILLLQVGQNYFKLCVLHRISRACEMLGHYARLLISRPVCTVLVV